jgi:RNA polymerase sigma factor (sigma-70 family)
MEDLLQAGYLGLHTAAYTYSPERGAAFSSYVVFHLRKAMREVVGLRKKRDLILDASSLDAPIDDDGDTALLDLLPATPDEYSIDQDDFTRIMREAVAKIQPKKVRKTVEAIYWEGQSVADLAASEGVATQAIYNRLQYAYEILRRNPSIVSLAIAAGYSSGTCGTGNLGISPEVAAIREEDAERRKKGLYHLLGDLVSLYSS